MIILVLKKSELDQAHTFQYSYCENFQIHLQVIAYSSKRANNDTHLNFLFQRFSILLLRAYNQYPVMFSMIKLL